MNNDTVYCATCREPILEKYRSNHLYVYPFHIIIDKPMAWFEEMEEEEAELHPREA